MDYFLSSVQSTIKKYNMIKKGDKIIVGVSGGPDSMALLNFLNSNKEELGIVIYVAHIEHNIRPIEGKKDAQFVKDFCLSLNIPFYMKEVNIKKIVKQRKVSEELAGREERYSFFFEVAKKVNANKIAIAHNKNDQSETLLMRLLRGTGLDGLKGILPIRKDGIIRPLIETSRYNIENYCKENAINFVLDKTNLEVKYMRNKIRHKIIPLLENEVNPNIIDTLSFMSDLFREDNDFYNSYLDSIMYKHIQKNEDNKVRIFLDDFLKEHPSIQKRLIRKAIELLKGDTLDFEYKHILSILNLCFKKDSGLRLDLPHYVVCEKQYNSIFFYFFDKKQKEKLKFNYHLKIGENTYINELDLTLFAYIKGKEKNLGKENHKYIACFDYEKINGVIYIRNRKNGDFIQPSGMKGKKKLKDFFIDCKIPRYQRDKIPLLAIDDEIIWIIGYRKTEKYQITEKTKKILYIELMEGNNV